MFAGLDDTQVRHLFGACMVILARYRQSPLPKPVPTRKAEKALIIATVLFEHAALRANQDPPQSYLRMRRKLLRQADRLDLSRG